MSDFERPPQVGDLATLLYPSDRYPYIVTAVSPGGHKVTLAELDASGHGPSRQAGPFPVFDIQLGPDAPRTGRTIVAHRGARGYVHAGSAPLLFGQARYYRDWSD